MEMNVVASPDASPALVLNADFRPLSYYPLSVWSWQETVKAVFLGRVNVVSEYEREVHSPRHVFKLPSVISLKKYAPMDRSPAFTRFNVFLRDRFTCQYCGTPNSTNELTFDHVVPVAQGGRKDWENIVTCCVSCNRKKGGRTPHEAGMRLLRHPRRPASAPAVRVTIGLRNAPESWRDYLYWNAELDQT